MEENYIWPEITEDTTLEEVKEIHRKIWDYAIEHGEKPETPYKFDCALCQYTNCLAISDITTGTGDWSCPGCPAIWGDNWCESPGSEYRKWKYSSGEEKKYWAKMVRDIPFKGDFGET